MNSTAKINPAACAFEEVCEGVLLGSLSFGEMSMHVEALRVHEDDEGCLRADAAQFDDHIEAMVTINGCAGFRTIEIDGFPGRWLVNILPMS